MEKPIKEKNHFLTYFFDIALEWPMIYFGVICGIQTAWMILAIIGTLAIITVLFVEKKPHEIEPCNFWFFWYEVITSCCILGIFFHFKEIFLFASYVLASAEWLRRRLIFKETFKTKYLWV